MLTVRIRRRGNAFAHRYARELPAYSGFGRWRALAGNVRPPQRRRRAIDAGSRLDSTRSLPWRWAAATFWADRPWRDSGGGVFGHRRGGRGYRRRERFSHLAGPSRASRVARVRSHADRVRLGGRTRTGGRNHHHAVPRIKVRWR